jgi:hypothetical protein
MPHNFRTWYSMAEAVFITVAHGYPSQQPFSFVWRYGLSSLTLRVYRFWVRLRACAGGVLDEELNCGIMAVCVLFARADGVASVV